MEPIQRDASRNSANLILVHQSTLEFWYKSRILNTSVTRTRHTSLPHRVRLQKMTPICEGKGKKKKNEGTLPNRSSTASREEGGKFNSARSRREESSTAPRPCTRKRSSKFVGIARERSDLLMLTSAGGEKRGKLTAARVGRQEVGREQRGWEEISRREAGQGRRRLRVGRD